MRFLALFSISFVTPVLALACGGQPGSRTSSTGPDGSDGNDSASGADDEDGGGPGSKPRRDDGGSTSEAAATPIQADLYVSPDGKDAWSGTLAMPNAHRTDGPTTLGAVQGKVHALQSGRTKPIVVFLEDGNYDLLRNLGGPWTLTVSGTGKAPIVYEAAPGATPVLSGGTAVTGWTKTTVNGVAAWQASAAGLLPFEQLWVNGERRYRPTTTPTGYLYNDNASHGDATTYSSFYFTGTDVQSWHDLANVEIADFESWTMPRMRIAKVDAANHQVKLTGSTATDFSHGFMPGHRYLAENVKEALAQPGQWYLDQLASPATLYYIPASGKEDPTNEAIVAPQLDQLVVAENLAHVTLRGLSFSYSNWTVPSGGWQDTQTESNPVAYVKAAVSLESSSSVTVDACVFAHLGGFGVELTGHASGETFPNATTDCKTTFDNRIINSEVTDTGGGGIRVGSSPTKTDTDANIPQCDLIQNDVVSGVGRFFPSGNGVFIGNAHHVTVRNNDVFDTYTYAIDVGATYGNRPGMTPYANVGNVHDTTIEYNHVHDVGQGVTSDIGGIYTATAGQTGNVVQNNVVHDITHDPGDGGYGGWGLYNDASSSNVTWQNNLVYRCSQGCMHFHYGMNGVIQNNIFAFGSLAVVEFSNPEAHLSFTFQNNIVYWDTTGIWQRGRWTCSLASRTDCYAFKDNLFVDVGGAALFTDRVSMQTLGTPPTGPFLTFAEWEGTGQDPSPSSDSFSLSFGTATAPTFTVPGSLPIAWKAFDPSLAGRTAPVLTPAPVAAGFPLQAWPDSF